MGLIYTLGTSNLKIEEFLEILKGLGIQAIIDVRRFPTSRWFEHFKKEHLERILNENNISYLHFEKLGGFRKEGYEEYMETEEFKECLKELIKIAEIKNLALLCAEKLPWKCHRAFIGKALEKEGIKVLHLIEKDKFWNMKENKEIKPMCQKKF